MKTRTLGNTLTVSEIGIGCMGMSFAYGGQEESAAIATLHRAMELGVTFFDTAELYGPYENEKILGKAFKGRRDKVVIATKFGIRYVDGQPRTDGSPATVRASLEGSLQRLGIDCVDLYYQHRMDPGTPIEETVGALADLVREGKIKAIGLSEANAATIRRAHKVHPITAIQTEYSLWTREPEREVLKTCRELGIGFVPYSPLGRGFLTGAIRTPEALDQGDWRRSQPRFQEDAIKANIKIVEAIERIAKKKDATPAQLALAWVLHQGKDIVPIPGVRKIKHLEENVKAVDVTLTADDLAAIDAAIPAGSTTGARYLPNQLAAIQE